MDGCGSTDLRDRATTNIHTHRPTPQKPPHKTSSLPPSLTRVPEQPRLQKRQHLGEGPRGVVEEVVVREEGAGELLFFFGL